MKTPPFYYLLKGSLFRYPGQESDLVEVSELFIDDNPLLARAKAFRAHQNYVDVLLDSKSSIFTNHWNAANLLQPYFNTFKRSLLKAGSELLADEEPDFDKGLFIYLVMGNSKTYQTREGLTVYEDKCLIHALCKQSFECEPVILDGLLKEFMLYTNHGIDVAEQAVPLLTNNELQTIVPNMILDTPIHIQNHIDKMLGK